MRYYAAQDTFQQELPDGSQRLVIKGAPLPESDALVQHDLARVKDDPGRTPLFAVLGEDEPPVKPSRVTRAK